MDGGKAKQASKRAKQGNISAFFASLSLSPTSSDEIFSSELIWCVINQIRMVVFERFCLQADESKMVFRSNDIHPFHIS